MGRQLGRHARICIASFEPAEGQLQKLVFIRLLVTQAQNIYVALYDRLGF